MATARATRRPDEYIDVANRIKSDFDKFDNGKGGFRDYYNTAIVPWLKIKDEIDARENPTVTPPSPQPDQIEMGADQGSPNISPPSDMGSSPSPPIGVPPGVMSSPPAAPMIHPKDEQVPDTQRMPQAPSHQSDENLPIPLVNQPKIRVAHQAFYKSLEILSKENPKILAKYISKYATSIQEADPETAIDLFKIAKRVKG
jgi:hypothetical protein